MTSGDVNQASARRWWHPTRFLANTALLIVTVVVSLGIGEMAVRLLYKDSVYLFPRYQTDYQFGPYLIRGIRPNSVFWHTSIDGSWKFTTNSRGFRSVREFSYEKPPNTYRVLALGDSHTQGYEVRQDFTYSAVLERFLTKHNGTAEVINTGVSGFSTAEALVLLENEGVKYRPDAVVLGFYANDFEDNLKAGLFGLDGDKLTERAFTHIPGVRIQNLIYSIPPVRWLGENSYFYSLLFNGVWDFFKARLARASAEAKTLDPGVAAPVGDAEYAIPTRSAFTPHEIALTAALLQRMQTVCAERGIRFVVVDIPSFDDEEAYSFTTSVPAALADRIAAAGIEYVSSQQVFQEFDGTREMHVQHGQHHISEFTHMMIGLEIGRRLATPTMVR